MTTELNNYLFKNNLTGHSDIVTMIAGREDIAIDLLPQGTPISQDFWESPTLEDLAHSQNILPMMDVSVMFGTWPGEDDDGFEAAIDELRHLRPAGGTL